MSDAMQLYQAVILDHSRAPRGQGGLTDPTHESEGFNAICGDKVTVTVKQQNGKILKLGFVAQSCALCQASASVLVETLEGQDIDRANMLVKAFEVMLKSGQWDFGGSAAAFAVMREFPARTKCVLLPWKTFQDAIENPEFGGARSKTFVATTEPVAKG